MSDLTVQALVKAGIAPTMNVAASGGDAFINDGRTFILVENGATDVTITFAAVPSTVEKPGYGTIDIADLTVTVTGSTQKLIGTFPQAVFNDSNGKVQMTYDDESNVIIAPVKFQEGK